MDRSKIFSTMKLLILWTFHWRYKSLRERTGIITAKSSEGPNSKSSLCQFQIIKIVLPTWMKTSLSGDFDQLLKHPGSKKLASFIDDNKDRRASARVNKLILSLMVWDVWYAITSGVSGWSRETLNMGQQLDSVAGFGATVNVMRENCRITFSATAKVLWDCIVNMARTITYYKKEHS